MAEVYEYETLLQQMLDRVPNQYDKREGSIIYNTLAPAALLCAQQAFMIAYMMDLLFADTAEGEWLDRVCADFGFARKEATYAERKINTFDSQGNPMAVPLKSRFSVENTSYVLTEELAIGQYHARCEQLGTQGNAYSGTIYPVDHLNNLGSAEMEALPLVAARDTETDESFRQRFYAAARKSPYGGNIADYEEKTLSVIGVGAVKVFPAHLMEEAGQVGIVIGDSRGKTASDKLVEAVQTEMGIDGDGIAPVGHTVTVKTSTDLPVHVQAEIKIRTGSTFSVIQPSVEKAISDYIEAVSFVDETIFFAKLQATILDSHPEIVDIGTVAMNGVSQNLELSKNFAAYQVPVVGTITVTEVA